MDLKWPWNENKDAIYWVYITDFDRSFIEIIEGGTIMDFRKLNTDSNLYMM